MLGTGPETEVGWEGERSQQAQILSSQEDDLGFTFLYCFLETYWLKINVTFQPCLVIAKSPLKGELRLAETYEQSHRRGGISGPGLFKTLSENTSFFVFSLIPSSVPAEWPWGLKDTVPVLSFLWWDGSHPPTWSHECVLSELETR